MRGIRCLVSLSVLGAALLCCGGTAVAQPWQGCTITTTSVSFGTYDVFNTVSLPSTGTISYRCFWWESIQVTLSKGLYAPGNNPRQLASGANLLSYNLYLDAAHTQIWGDPNPNHYDNSGWFISGSVTIYGLIPAGQDVAAGIYSDNITATINF
jgi:spore coat protein U-like protein